VTGVEQGSELADVLPKIENLICDHLRRSGNHQALEATLQVQVGIRAGRVVAHHVKRSTARELRLHHSKVEPVRAIVAIGIPARGGLVIGNENAAGDTPPRGAR